MEGGAGWTEMFKYSRIKRKLAEEWALLLSCNLAVTLNPPTGRSMLRGVECSLVSGWSHPFPATMRLHKRSESRTVRALPFYLGRAFSDLPIAEILTVLVGSTGR